MPTTPIRLTAGTARRFALLSAALAAALAGCGSSAQCATSACPNDATKTFQACGSEGSAVTDQFGGQSCVVNGSSADGLACAQALANWCAGLGGGGGSGGGAGGGSGGGSGGGAQGSGAGYTLTVTRAVEESAISDFSNEVRATISITLTNTAHAQPLSFLTFDLISNAGLETPAPTATTCPSQLLAKGGHQSCDISFASGVGALGTLEYHPGAGEPVLSIPLSVAACTYCESSGGTPAGPCYDLQSGSSYCGSCAVPVSSDANAAVCQGGALVCPSGGTICEGNCVDLRTSVTDCGRCGVAAPANGACNAGVPGCPSGTTACNGTCVDLKTSASNCGACGTTVPRGATCVNGAPNCGGGSMADCSGVCVDTATDGNNCGACGVQVGAGATCNYGTPICREQGYYVCSDHACHDFDTDDANCGSCGHACGADASCGDYSQNQLFEAGRCTSQMSTTTYSANLSCNSLCATKGLTCFDDGWNNYVVYGSSSLTAGCSDVMTPTEGNDVFKSLTCGCVE